jgi:hypothetical protein
MGFQLSRDHILSISYAKEGLEFPQLHLRIVASPYPRGQRNNIKNKIICRDGLPKYVMEHTYLVLRLLALSCRNLNIFYTTYRYKSIRSAFYFLRQFFQVISHVFLELSVTTVNQTVAFYSTLKGQWHENFCPLAFIINRPHLGPVS